MWINIRIMNFFIIWTIVSVVNKLHFVVAVRPGGPCDSQFGEGVCTAITQCKLLPRIKNLGHIPKMCGYDSNGPIVCCPKYNHGLQNPKSNHQIPSNVRRPDLDFDHEMQGDQPRIFNDRQQSDDYYYSYNTDKTTSKYNKYNERINGWNRDDDYSNLSPRPTSSSSTNGKRKYNRPDISTNSYQGFGEENDFGPQRRPPIESNSFETNKYRPDFYDTNSFSSNPEYSFNSQPNINRPFTNTNQWNNNNNNNNNRPSFNNPSTNINRPFNERPNKFGSNGNEDIDELPIWGSVQDRTTTRRPSSSTYQNRYSTTRRPSSSTSQNGVSRPKRISQTKCEEYSGIVTNNLRPLPLLPNPDFGPAPTTQKCEIEAEPVALIVGGKDTFAGEFPHMAAIGYQNRGSISWDCGGTLISDEYVLTAAHCIHTPKGQPVRVRLGDWDLRRNDDAETADYRIIRIIVHPSYSKTKKYNDIALLRLEDKVRFRNTIRPACLFDRDNIPQNRSIAIGWGRVETAGAKSGILQKVDLPIVNNRKCNELYRDMKSEASLNDGIADSMLCAGDLSGGYDTCLGDSGGPLQFRNKENRCVYHVIGITSFGKAMCGSRNSPGVYTRVSSYLPWIENIVW